MVASSIAKAVNDVDDAGYADDCDGAPLPHERLPAMAAAAISPVRNIRSLRTLNAVTSLRVCIVLRRDAAVNRSPRHKMPGNPR
jgi:hypothetical protein